MLINKKWQLTLKYLGLKFQIYRIPRSIGQKFFVIINHGYFSKDFGVEGREREMPLKKMGREKDCVCVCACVREKERETSTGER